MYDFATGRSYCLCWDAEGRLVSQGLEHDMLYYIYDDSGLLALERNDELFLVQRDVQGHIIAILDTNGNAVVKYKYDAWGSELKTVNNCF